MTSSKGEGMTTDDRPGWLLGTARDAELRYAEYVARRLRNERFPAGDGMKTGDLVTFSPRAGESAEGIVTRVWDKPAADPYVTLRTTEDEGRTFTRCSSVVVKI
jgi:hypothetical protein